MQEVLLRIVVGPGGALAVGVEQDARLVAGEQLGAQLQAEGGREAVEATSQVGAAGRHLDRGDGRGHAARVYEGSGAGQLGVAEAADQVVVDHARRTA